VALAVSRKSVANFAHALLAVLVGNLVYFLLMPHLPPGARHVPLRTDFGLAVDFCFCLVFFAIIKTLAGRKRESRLGRR
jgi:hypothetical protein